MSSPAAMPEVYRDFAAVDAHIRSLGNQELIDWLDSMDSSPSWDLFVNIHRNRFYPIHMNLSSIFWGKKSETAILSSSVEATKLTTWFNHFVEHYLASLSGPETLASSAVHSIPKLNGWKFDLIESLLAQGKGLVIASFRFGLYHCIPLGLAGRGFDVCMPLVTPKYNSANAELVKLRERLAHGWTTVESQQDLEHVSNLARLTVEDLEAEGATLTLAETLKQGKIMFVFTEGNNGADGPWGGTCKVPMDFMGLPAAAKSGLARLATFSGAPILPVISVMKSRSEADLVFGEPIIPPAGMKRPQREAFAETATVALYRFLERFVQEHPGQWAGVSALHRWRVLPAQEADQNTTSESVAEELAGGGNYRLSAPDSLLSIPVTEGEIWVDLPTLRSIQVPPWAHGILKALSATGINADWLDHYAAEGGSRNSVLGLLARLCGRRIVTPSASHDLVAG